jgi:hypothetical protein
MAGLRRLLIRGAVAVVLLASPLIAGPPAAAQNPPAPVPSSVPEAVLQDLLSVDLGAFTVSPTSTGLVFRWAASSVAFDAGAHAVVAEGGGAPPLTLRSSLVGPPNPSTVGGRIVVDSQPSSHRDVVYAPFADGVETLDVLASPAAPRTLRWGVESNGQPLLVDIDRGLATAGDGAVVSRFDGVTVLTAAGEPVPVKVKGGLGYLEVTVVGDHPASDYPIVVDPTWNRTTKTYTEDRFGFGRNHKYRVRGYNFRACIETGVNCRTNAGAYKPEPTAQAHAIRRLAKLRGSSNPLRRTVPDTLDWEAGKRDDPIEEPPCDGTAGFRVDIVLDVSGTFDLGGHYRLIEVKNINQIDQVEPQLDCYMLKMGAGGDNLNVGRLDDLSDEQWAVTWIQEPPDPPTRWYAWAPAPGYVLFGNDSDASMGRIPREVVDKAHETGHERFYLPGASLDLLPELKPVPRPGPVQPVPPIFVP